MEAVDKFVKVPVRVMRALMEDADGYNALRNSGVDNWDGWDYHWEYREYGRESEREGLEDVILTEYEEMK